jgi:hypothetical protein
VRQHDDGSERAEGACSLLLSTRRKRAAGIGVSLARAAGDMSNATLISSSEAMSEEALLFDEGVDVWTYIERRLGARHLPLTTVAPMTVVYAVIFVVGVMGNACTCLVILRNKYMQTPTNVYLASLALSDLLTQVVGEQVLLQEAIRIPYGIYRKIRIFKNNLSGLNEKFRENNKNFKRYFSPPFPERPKLGPTAIRKAIKNKALSASSDEILSGSFPFLALF